LAELKGGSTVRKILIVLLLLVAAGIGFGFYRGWFSFGSSSDSETGKTDYQFRIDRDKMKSDYEKARQRISGKDSQTKEQTGGN
jgi:hypothetical protein